MTVVGNNHLLPQASLAPNQKGAQAAPQAKTNHDWLPVAEPGAATALEAQL